MDAQSKKLFKGPITGEFTDNLNPTARDAAILHVVGSQMDADWLSEFIGLPGGSEAFVDVRGSEIHIGGFHADKNFEMSALLRTDGTARVADFLTMNRGDFPSGTGTRILARFAQNLQDAGFDRINAHLYGGPGLAHNGYYSWVVVGFDMEIPPLALDQLHQEGIEDVKTVHDFFDAYGAQAVEWWKEHDVGGRGWLELDPSSRGWTNLQDYLTKKGVRIN